MINGVNQNIIFLTMKKILRPFSYKLTNSKTQILLYINITKTSVNLFIVQFVGFFFLVLFAITLLEENRRFKPSAVSAYRYI